MDCLIQAILPHSSNIYLALSMPPSRVNDILHAGNIYLLICLGMPPFRKCLRLCKGNVTSNHASIQEMPSHNTYLKALLPYAVQYYLNIVYVFIQAMLPHEAVYTSYHASIHKGNAFLIILNQQAILTYPGNVYLIVCLHPGNICLSCLDALLDRPLWGSELTGVLTRKLLQLQSTIKTIKNS